jgi:Family of unknown function (DUF6267)
MKLEFITEIAGAEVRTPHPEDAIFDGAAAALRAVEALKWVIENPGTATIKWDGMPAVIFGRNNQGQFIITDKYMFDKPNGRAASPEDWVKYDQSRGVTRADLYQKISNIWNGLEIALGNSPGFYWGDLLWANELQPSQGYFLFKPNIVSYRVAVKSPLGQQIQGRVGGLVVHSWLSDETAKPQPWNGQGLDLNAPVAIIRPNADIKFTLDDPVRLRTTAEKNLNGLGSAADRFLNGLDNVAKSAIKKYANHAITKQTDAALIEWLQNEVSGKQYRKLVGENQGGYLYREQQGLDAVFSIWNSIYALKVNLAQQLESQVKGLEQFVNNQPEGEGFVFTTPLGTIKLVQRGTFSQALFNK